MFDVGTWRATSFFFVILNEVKDLGNIHIIVHRRLIYEL